MITDYTYNSQDQVTDYSHLGDNVNISFRNTYDYAGRLNSLDKYDIPDVPNPDLINLAQYSYNGNSQLTELILGGSIRNNHFYDSRGRIIYFQNNDGMFEYTNEYFLNGNVKSQEFSGSYKDNFTNTSALNFNYTYDLSNRLLETENDNTQHKDNFKLENKYDKDGNITELKRYNGSGSVTDNFNYSYYSGTNKLQRVSGGGNQFIYDNNGNVTSEALNNNSEMKYDHRILLTQLRHRSQIITDSSYYVSYYNYDEAGNRISKKVYKYTGSQPEPPPPDIDSLDAETDWELEVDVIYSCDVTGKELAIYESGLLLQWNIWGLDNVGKIDAVGLKYYYLKDHLGSIRVIMDENQAVVFAEDYDAWGYGLEERNYAKDNSLYKFTGKERDKESEYDYFGARYYDARIGRWGQVEPLLDKYPSLTPYNYSLNNPLRVIDPNGADPFEIIVRTYIPFDIVAPGFKGDSRGADPNATSYRTEQRIIVETDRRVSPTIIQNYDANISPSILYLPTSPSTTIVSGLGEGTFSGIAGYSSDINEGNNVTVELTGSANVGVIPATLSPSIDYSFGIIILPQKDGSVKIQLSGSHDKFPAYEIYVKDKLGNVTPIYNQSPVDPISGPFRLFPNPLGSQKVNSELIIP